LQRVVFTVRRTARVVVASVVLELALDFGAGALAVVLAPFVGRWVYAAAGVIVVGSLPVLGLNIARVARREWRRHHVDHTPRDHRRGELNRASDRADGPPGGNSTPQGDATRPPRAEAVSSEMEPNTPNGGNPRADVESATTNADP
jgi:hypothetical protein